MTLDEKIAALPKMPLPPAFPPPEQRNTSNAPAAYSVLVAECALARLALLRDTLQAMVASHACEDDGTPPCSNCADARKVLEATR